MPITPLGQSGHSIASSASTTQSTTARSPSVRPSRTAARTPGPTEKPLTLTEIIQEAVRRSGISEEAGSFDKADIITINQEIRKDPVLLDALMQVRGEAKRRQTKLLDVEDAVRSTQEKRSRRGSKTTSIDGDDRAEEPNFDDELEYVQKNLTEFRVNPVAGVDEADVTENMLRLFDLDGDGIIAVRQMLQYLIFYEERRFNRVELANLLKVMNEGFFVAA